MRDMNTPVSQSRGGPSARGWVALGFSAACWILLTGCDDARPGDSTREHPPASRPAEDTRSQVQASSRISSEAKARHLLEALGRMSSDDVAAALGNPAEFEMIMSLDPDAIMDFYRSATRAEDVERSQTANMLLRAYFREMSVRSPGLLAAYVERADADRVFKALVYLAQSSPELAFSVIQDRVSAQNQESLLVLYFKETAEVIAEEDPELAIRLINDSPVVDHGVMDKVMYGFAMGVNPEKLSPSEAAALLSRFSPERLAAHPEVAWIARFYSNSPPAAVLPFFPLDGAPWQRAGAIAYLEAAAFKGMNGDVYVSEFLESPQAALLTDQERGRLRHILRK